MRAGRLETWALRSSPLHCIDPRAKLFGVIALLVSLSLSSGSLPLTVLVHAGILLPAVYSAGLPLGGLMLRAAVVIPFVAGILLLNLYRGDLDIAAWVLTRSYLSALAVTLLLATTPLPRLLGALGSLGVPQFFLLVLHILYRYLNVFTEQVHRMIQARSCRSPHAPRRLQWRAAAGTVAALFLSTTSRAERLHRAMLSRGFTGQGPVLATLRMQGADWALAGGLMAALTALHLWQACSSN